MWSPVTPKLLEEVNHRSRTVAQCGCRQEAWAAESWNFAQSCLLKWMLPGKRDAYRKGGHRENDIPAWKVHRLFPDNPSPWPKLQVWETEAEATKKIPSLTSIPLLRWQKSLAVKTEYIILLQNFALISSQLFSSQTTFDDLPPMAYHLAEMDSGCSSKIMS